MNEELIELFNLVHSNVSQNNIVYENKEGELYSSNVSEFANQPIEVILDSLGMNINDVIERSQKDMSRFINEMAIINLICHFKENWYNREEE